MSLVFFDRASASTLAARFEAKDANSEYCANGKNVPLGPSFAFAPMSSVSPLIPAITSPVDILVMTARPSGPLCCTNHVLEEVVALAAERAASSAELSRPPAPGG